MTERNGNTEKGCQKPAVQQKTTAGDPLNASILLAGDRKGIRPVKPSMSHTTVTSLSPF